MSASTVHAFSTVRVSKVIQNYSMELGKRGKEKENDRASVKP
jgi:hypothetical protein